MKRGRRKYELSSRRVEIRKTMRLSAGETKLLENEAKGIDKLFQN